VDLTRSGRHSALGPYLSVFRREERAVSVPQRGRCAFPPPRALDCGSGGRFFCDSKFGAVTRGRGWSGGLPGIDFLQRSAEWKACIAARDIACAGDSLHTARATIAASLTGARPAARLLCCAVTRSIPAVPRWPLRRFATAF